MSKKVKVRITAVERITHAADVELDESEYDELLELRDRGSSAFGDRVVQLLDAHGSAFRSGTVHSHDIELRRVK